MRSIKHLLPATVALMAITGVSFASEATASCELTDLADVQKYFRSIHIMAMLLMGFVKKYGRSTSRRTAWDSSAGSTLTSTG